MRNEEYGKSGGVGRPQRFRDRPRVALLVLALGAVGLVLTALIVFVSMGPASSALAGWFGMAALQGDAVHGRQLAQRQCAACHGLEGNSTNPTIPKLAEQKADYLYAQLWAFHSGQRHSQIMSPMVAHLSESDAHDLAVYYSQQRRRPDPVKDRALLPRGRAIFASGEGGWSMTQCAMCHAKGGGMMGHGMMGMMGGANAPNLNGQHAAYLVTQLDRFADGQRQGTVMNRIAALMRPEDRKAIAAYLSGLP